jgi:hypothetical protein
MQMSRKDVDLHTHGARGSWASNGGLWANAAARLLPSRFFPEILLGCVALHLALKNAVLLVMGRQGVRSDTEAAAGCPFRPDELQALEERLTRIRDHILHHADRISEGGGFELSFPNRTITTTRITKHGTEIESLALDEASNLAAKLEPWFRAQLLRYAPEPAPDLRDKIQAVMDELAKRDAEQ